MKKVEVLERFEYKGHPVAPGDRFEMEDLEVNKRRAQGQVKVLITPENRQRK